MSDGSRGMTVFAEGWSAGGAGGGGGSSLTGEESRQLKANSLSWALWEEGGGLKHTLPRLSSSQNLDAVIA